MVDVQPDGLLLFEDSVRSESIRSALEYGGVRVRLAADLDGARIALRPEFTSDVGKRAQWSAFSWRTEMSPVLSLESIAEVLRRFLLTPASTVVHRELFNQEWPAGGVWRYA